MRTLPLGLHRVPTASGGGGGATGPLLMVLLSLGSAGIFSPGGASAHPMGQFSANRQALLVPARDKIEIRYYADFAEIPAQAEVKRIAAEGDAYALNRMRELAANLTLAADGKELPIEIQSAEAVKVPGQAGLETITVIAMLAARWPSRWDGPRRLRFSDRNFHGLAGWHEIRVEVSGEYVTGGVPPQALLSPGEIFKPLSYTGRPRADDEVVFSLDFGAAATATEPAGLATRILPARRRAPDPLVELIGADVMTLPVLLFALAVSAALGASHALSPGHGKTVVAAYLVGSRGTVSHAVLLGLVVTLTHVSSVIVLGIVTLYLSEFILPERLYPWLGVASGAAVAVIGLVLLVSRLRSAPPRAEHSHRHSHRARTHPSPAHRHESEANDHPVGREEGTVSLPGLLALGVTGGIIPCPSALVVLLAAVALHRIALGLTLILAFSVGLAVVLITIGVLAVKAYRLIARFEGFGALTRGLGVASAAAVTILGILIALKTGAALM